MMSAMKRTTIFLPDELHEDLRQEAFRERISMAELIRRRLARNLRPRARRGRVQHDDPILAVAGICSGDGKLSQNFDEELYEL
jgi:hypothetical protein